MILFCGGTIVMQKKSDGSLTVPHNTEEAIKILKEIEPNLNQLAVYDIEYIANIDSTNITTREWDLIIQKIYDRYDHYDGFVITHGTDTMAYTASALSIAIQNLGKPVVLTGSQLPAVKIENDARRNLINAIRVAIMDVSGVFIVFDEKIILGSRASKASESKLNAFTTVNDNDIGEISIKIKFKNEVEKRKDTTLNIIKGFESDIIVFTLTPGCDSSDLEFLLNNQRIKGIIIRAFGTGNIPYSFENFFKKAKKKKLPIIISSQCLHGKTEMAAYDVGKRALQLGVIEGLDQSLEMLTVKLMWALKKYKYEDLKRVMHNNYSGEVRNTTFCSTLKIKQ
jgi:L-asparaginase